MTSKKKKRPLVLSAEQQTRVTAVLLQVARDVQEAEDRDVLEDQALKRAASRTQIYDQELIAYATEGGSDWRAPGRLEQVRKLRDQDANSALSRRLNHRGGKPCKYNKPAIRAALQKRHAEHLDEDWLIAIRLVAAGVQPKDGDAPADVRRAVRRYCRDLCWLSKRKGHIAAT